MSEKPGFTKGPWRQELPEPGYRFAQTGDRLIYAANGLAVAMAINDGPPDAEPNAHLIAAAPDLYEEGRKAERLLEQAADFLGNRGFLDLADELRIQRRELAVALAKAEGRT